MKIKTTILSLVTLLLVCTLPVSGSETPTSETRHDVVEQRVAGPVGGAVGQRLRVAVAALPRPVCLPTCSDAFVRILVHAADATDLEPVAEMPWTRVESGRSLTLDYDFASRTLAGRDEVVVRLWVRRSTSKEGSTVTDFTASVQVMEIADNRNQLWGDWYIVDP